MQKKRPSVAVAVLGAEFSGGDAPRDFRIIPSGQFRAWDGRPSECPAWVCTRDDGEQIVRAINARTSACVIDYEHATLLSKKTGQKAVAAGWFKQAEWRDDGVWLIGVDWTALAAQHIADHEYRYLSPVFPYDDKTGRVLGLYHASLTNDPALDGLTDLAALAAQLFSEQPTQEDSPMDELIEQLRWLLNLPVGASADDIAAHLQKLITQLKASNPVAANSGGFGIGEHLAALSAKVSSPDPSCFVPVATLTALQSEYATLQQQFAALSASVDGTRLDQLIESGIAAGKIVPATEQWARNLGQSNLASLAAFIESSPAIVAPGGTQSGGAGPQVGKDGAQDGAAIAALAVQYQNEQLGKGIYVNTAQAVAYVTKKGS